MLSSIFPIEDIGQRILPIALSPAPLYPLPLLAQQNNLFLWKVQPNLPRVWIIFSINEWLIPGNDLEKFIVINFNKCCPSAHFPKGFLYQATRGRGSYKCIQWRLPSKPLL